MNSPPRILRTAAVILASLVPAACGLLGDRSLEASLQNFALASWADVGVQFMGRYGSGPITTVAAQSPDSWSVTYPDVDVAGGAVIGEFQITQLEAYPIFEGEAYAQHLHEAAAAVNRRDGLTQEARTVVRDGDYRAIGLVRVQVTLSSRAGREVVQRLAVMPRAFGGKWEFRDEDRTLGTLWRATRVLFDDMMRNDDRVINCTRGVDVSRDRGPSLECATTVLGREFAS